MTDGGRTVDVEDVPSATDACGPRTPEGPNVSQKEVGEGSDFLADLNCKVAQGLDLLLESGLLKIGARSRLHDGNELVVRLQIRGARGQLVDLCSRQSEEPVDLGFVQTLERLSISSQIILQLLLKYG